MVQVNGKDGECLFLRAVLRHCWWSPEGSCAPGNGMMRTSKWCQHQQLWWDVAVSPKSTLNRSPATPRTQTQTCLCLQTVESTLTEWRRCSNTAAEWVQTHLQSSFTAGGLCVGAPAAGSDPYLWLMSLRPFLLPALHLPLKEINATFQLCWQLDVHVTICARPSRTTTALKHFFLLFYLFI